MTAQLMTATEVAARLRVSCGLFYRRLPKLRAEHGFPHPHPASGRLLWRPEAIERWLDRVEIDSCSPGMVDERHAATVADAAEAQMAEAQQEMDRRAAGMRRVG